MKSRKKGKQTSREKTKQKQIDGTCAPNVSLVGLAHDRPMCSEYLCYKWRIGNVVVNGKSLFHEETKFCYHFYFKKIVHVRKWGVLFIKKQI